MKKRLIAWMLAVSIFMTTGTVSADEINRAEQPDILTQSTEESFLNVKGSSRLTESKVLKFLKKYDSDGYYIFLRVKTSHGCL